MFLTKATRRLASLGLAGALCAGAGTLLSGCAGGGGASGGSTAAMNTAPGQYVFWPQFPDDPRVQFIQSFKSSEDVSSRQASGFEKLVFGRDAEPTDLINKPYGVAMRDGKVYVCDIRNDSLMVMDLKKKQSRIVGATGMNTLKQPVAVAVADNGEIFVGDIERGAVFVYDTSERFSRMFGHPKFKPAGIAIHANRVYVTSTSSQVVEVFDRASGEQVGTIGSVGDGDGQFRLPLGVATDSKGNVWVADMMRCRVQKFSPEGQLIKAFGEMGDYRGSFARPKHIAVDSDDVVYVVDAAFQNVQMFNAEGQALMHFGAAGNFPGAMNLPAGVCVSEDSVGVVAGRVHPGFVAKRVVAVTNQFGGEKVTLYAMGELKSGFTAKDVSGGSVKVATGIDASPSAERLKLQSPGDQEPAPAPAEEGSEAGSNAPPAKGGPAPKN